MRVLDIAPPEQWIEYDGTLSLQVRRITIHEAHEIVQGTALARVFEGGGSGDADVSLPQGELLGLCDRIFEVMVVDWTVQAPDGGKVPVTRQAWRWLLTDDPALISWLLNRVFLGAAAAEAEVEREKGD